MSILEQIAGNGVLTGAFIGLLIIAAFWVVELLHILRPKRRRRR